ncbi:3-deoxy-7-phosphoheptulonate synthase [Phycisphaera mikurensis]|uniref:Phospho-2-dehydro-3-deoxyheptonate aldolase n=1 Tax=Phycisphaera mikurensis (strain NBRC 102666 / KCTC 22515 / FYK2301M01) TaxID=1142394 RepID=I0IBE3_PHYMF|nr:3-deoxy-7-phosphoheptulonate synthase [Phycisphaera mikurensis]MBB6442886.1 3-deoxy-7-phosphoheptulonate synthase [Phycisphaera mikurensis]BAM02581.1 phospho-2-dehydro-3-deoxyheptonate aldolase [Phycisphaera mikurensis NBRC 102666]
MTAASPTQNLNVTGFDPLISPGGLNEALPISAAAAATVTRGRDDIQRILRGDDPRLLAVVGPCSIHDVDAAGEYAQRLAALAEEVSDRLLVVMRVYFEKPRTTVGWKGLINDPFLYSDRVFDMNTGIRRARELLMRIAELGLPAGTEFLDPFTPQYLDDLVSWAAIGARTTESQTHRQMASGLSMPVGFKNATTGDLQVALDAMKSAMAPHHFVGIDEEGHAAVVHTRGNAYGHAILRGGHSATNYAPEDIAAAAGRLVAAGLNPQLMVDCSHANSGKKHTAQAKVWDSVLAQRAAGQRALVGVMLESNLEPGNQGVPTGPNGRPDASKLLRGVSITDACIGFEETQRLLRAAQA